MVKMAGKGGKQKSSPGLKRASKASTKLKYKRQFIRTFENKLRRVRRSNGPEAAKAYQSQYSLAAHKAATEKSNVLLS
jgi:hypothetical protein